MSVTVSATPPNSVYQALIEAELPDIIGAGLHERSAERTKLRNGHRTRTLTTAGHLELRIPKLRTGSFLPTPDGHGVSVRPTESGALVSTDT